MSLTGQGANRQETREKALRGMVLKAVEKHSNGFKHFKYTVEAYTKKCYDKKSRLSILIFGLWMSELVVLDLKIRFLVANCICSQLEMSRLPKNGQRFVCKN